MILSSILVSLYVAKCVRKDMCIDFTNTSDMIQVAIKHPIPFGWIGISANNNAQDKISRHITTIRNTQNYTNYLVASFDIDDDNYETFGPDYQSEIIRFDNSNVILKIPMPDYTHVTKNLNGKKEINWSWYYSNHLVLSDLYDTKLDNIQQSGNTNQVLSEIIFNTYLTIIHVICMFISCNIMLFISLCTLSYRLSIPMDWYKYHSYFGFAAVILATIGIFSSPDSTGYQSNFSSIHKWVGIISIIILNFELIIAFVMYMRYRYTTDETPIIRTIHRYIGWALVVILQIEIYLGVFCLDMEVVTVWNVTIFSILIVEFIIYMIPYY